ncbi:hypothetical protein MKW92_042104 [Papaver armeniacum]|nr:hypothetical protein MKW92_042104 [Papaver armeniacum]
MLSESSSSSLEPSSQVNNVVSSLMRFKHSSIEKDPSGYLANWTVSNSLSSIPCSWKGIICSTDGQVTALNFTDAGLTGHLHIDDIKSLENLKHLYLGGNYFYGNLSHNRTLPCTFETIDLSSNRFDVPISTQFFSSLL